MPRSKFLMALIIAFAAAYSQGAFAGAVITYHGRILDSADRPVESSAVTFRIRIYSPNPGKCLLYEESRTVSMVNSNGIFVIPIGDGVGNRSATSDPGISLEDIFSNNPNVTLDRTTYPKFTCNTGGHSYTAQSLDQRQLLVSFDDNSGAGEQVLPITDIGFVPLAVGAYDSQKIGGTPANSVVRLSSGNATPISSGQFTELMNLITGVSTQYAKSNQLNGSSLPALSSGQSLGWNGSSWVATTPLTAETDPSVKTFAKTDLPTTCGTDKFLRPKSDGSGFDCIAPSGGGSGDITDVVAGTGLSGGGTSGSVTLNLSNVGTAGDYYKVTTDAQGRVTAGQGALVAADIPALPTSKITSGTFADSFLAGISVDKILNGAGKYFNYKPANTACADNEVLKYDSTLNAGAGGWKCATDSGVGSETDPSVSAFAKTTVSTGLKLNGSNQLEVDTGTTVGKIVQLGASGRLPAVDGSLLTNLPTGTNFSGSLAGDVTGTQGATVVSRLNGLPVSSAVAGDDTKFLKYVHGSGWEPHFVKLSELRNATGVSSAFSVGSCTAAQTLAWSSITDQFSCQAINGIPAANVTGLGSLATQSAVALGSDVSGVLPIANGGTGTNSVAQNLFFAGPDSSTGAPSFRAIASSDLPSTVKYWTAATDGINYSGGKIGVGTTTPLTSLDVVGSIVASRGIGGSIPAGSVVLMNTCPSGWTDNGALGGGPSGATCNGTSCRMCQSPATPSLVPASSILLLEKCPATWTYLNTAGGGGEASLVTPYHSCQSPASAVALPLGTRVVMSSCPAEWNDMGSFPGGPGGAVCGALPCHSCEVAGVTTPEFMQSSGSTLSLQPTTGNVMVGAGTPTEKLTVVGSVKATSFKVTWTTLTTAQSGTTLTGVTNLFLDVSGGAINLTLPAAPKHGDTIKLVHAAGTLSTNNVTVIAGTGDTIVGDANLIMDINNGSLEIIFFDPNDDGNGDWRIM